MEQSPVPIIIADYLERLRLQLQRLPGRERDEFVREMESHIHGAYRQMPGDDPVARILAVLRRVGEPVDFASQQLPAAMVQVGRKRNAPLYILTGIVVALFGVPLGFGGVGVLFGLLTALTGLLLAWYVLAGSMCTAGGILAFAAFLRLFAPATWAQLEAAGAVHSDIIPGAPPPVQACLLMLAGLACLAIGTGLWRLGKHLTRGLRLLFHMATDWTRRGTRAVGRKLSRRPEPPVIANTIPRRA